MHSTSPSRTATAPLTPAPFAQAPLAPTASALPKKEKRFTLDQPLAQRHVKYVMEDLDEVIGRWHTLGTMLSVNSGIISAIGATAISSITCDQKLQKTLTEWLNKGKETSWPKLIRAVKSVGYDALARKIQTQCDAGKYPNRELNIEDLSTLTRLLDDMKSETTMLGTFLHLGSDTIKQIEGGRGCRELLTDIIIEAMKRPKGLNYGEIIEALESTTIGNNRLARIIKTNRITQE